MGSSGNRCNCTTMSSSKSSASGSTFRVLSAITVAVLSIPVAKTIQAGDPLIYMIPNFLLLTPFHKAAVPIWKFQEFTDNFRYPAVIKGLLLNTTGVAKWATKGYLSER